MRWFSKATVPTGRGRATNTIRIEKSCEVTINLGDRNFCKASNSASTEFEYSSPDELAAAENKIRKHVADGLRQDVLNCLGTIGRRVEDYESFAKLAADRAARKRQPQTEAPVAESSSSVPEAK